MFNKIVKNLLYTNNGKIIISIIFGLGLASIFRKICEKKECYEFIGPKQNEIRNKIFSYDQQNNECYKVVEKNTKCDSNKKIVDFE